MVEEDFRSLARGAAYSLGFDAYLRTGLFLTDLDDYEEEWIELKYNHAHDPANGQFTFSTGGASGVSPHVGRQDRRGSQPIQANRPANPHTQKPRQNRSDTPAEVARRVGYYQGVTAQGVGIIRPTSGGHVDSTGHYVPEIFPPDPYHLSDPVSALAHYIAGSGTERNFYLNTVDTSHVKVSDFRRLQKVIDWGRPGRYYFKDVPHHNFDSSLPWDISKSSAATTVGRLKLRLTGSLAVGKNGRYSFSGFLGSMPDPYDFNPSHGRTAAGEGLTTIGRMVSGKPFRIYVVGTKPFTASGYTPIRQHR